MNRRFFFSLFPLLATFRLSPKGKDARGIFSNMEWGFKQWPGYVRVWNKEKGAYEYYKYQLDEGKLVFTRVPFLPEEINQ